jgi:predicted metalloprotease
MKKKILTSLLSIVLAALLLPASLERSAAAAPKPDMPLMTLLSYASGDINGFWIQSFTANRTLYKQPAMIYYVAPIQTPCGLSVLNNAFYCGASNTIYYDYNFINRMYSTVGDYAAVSIIAHEWGHLVQAQLGISRGNNFSIQMELQADCFAGAYTKYAESKHELEEGDIEEAGVGLFNAGDPKGMAWFASEAHGKPMQRIGSFLDGYKGGPAPCFPKTR